MNIIDISDYDLEDTCHALNKIQSIADLFNAEKIGEGRNLTQEGLLGIYGVLHESVFELRTIIEKEVDTVYEVHGLREEVKELRKALEFYRLKEYSENDVIKLVDVKPEVRHAK